MTRTQRTILLALPIQAAIIFVFFYLTKYWFIGIALQAGMTMLLMRQLLTKGNNLIIVAKSLQPFAFVSTISLYNLLLAQLYGVSLQVFLIQTLVASVLYGIFSYVALRQRMSVGFASVLTILQISLSVNFVSLAMAYWRIPTFIMLPLSIVAIGYFAMWWLLEIGKNESNVPLVSAVFALLATELIWVYSHWVIVYQVPYVNLVITQTTAVVVALAYGLGGIYYHRGNKPVRLQLIVEYMLVFIVIFLATLVSTRWINGI